MRKSFFWMLLLLLWFSGCKPLDSGNLKLDTRPATQWEYHIGDFNAVESGKTERLHVELEQAQWNNIAQPLNPPERTRQYWVWYRTPLPSIMPGDHFYLRGVDERFEVYLQGVRIHSFGKLPPDTPQYLGFPWQMFSLEGAQAGDYLYFRVYSDYRHIGIFGTPRIGSPEAHLGIMVHQDFDRVVVGSLMIFTGLFVLLLFIRQPIQGYALLCLFGVTIGLYTICRTELKQVLLYAPALWKWTELICLYIAAPAIGFFLNQMFRGRLSKTWDAVLGIQLLFGFSSLVLAALGEISLQDTSQPFLWTILVSIPLGFSVVFLNFKKLGKQALISIAGLLCFCGFSAFDVLVSLKLFPWSPPVSHWGLLVLLMTLVFLVKAQVENLYHAKRLAEEANLNKTQFLTNFSHEIRTPLNAILGFSKLLLNETEKGDKKHQKAEIIHRSGETLLSLINDILDLSKIEADRLEITPQQINLKQILEEIHALFSLQMARKNIVWETHINPNAPEEVLLDDVKLRQIILNLVGNALKFTAQGSIRMEFEAQLFQTGFTDLHIHIKDTGIGIPQSEQDKIFQAFYQVSAEANREYAGTGLGLSITERLVKLLGGKIKVKSEVGKGTEFHVVLPGLPVTQAVTKKEHPTEQQAGQFKTRRLKLTQAEQQELEEQLKRLQGNRSINRIQRLSDQLSTHQDANLQKYGQRLAAAVQQFNIEEINQILNELQESLQQI